MRTEDRNDEDASCTHIFVSGRVQGVFFRQSTRDHCIAAGLTGWVRNLPDGRVEALLCGPAEDVSTVLAWMRAGGPPAARVDSLDTELRACLGPTQFLIED